MEKKKVGPTGVSRVRSDDAKFEIETLRLRWGIHVNGFNHERFASLLKFLHQPLARGEAQEAVEQLVVMSGLSCDHAGLEHRFSFYLNVRHEVRGAKFTDEGRDMLSRLLGIELHWPESDSAGTKVA